jgi:hypothetical protein
LSKERRRRRRRLFLGMEKKGVGMGRRKSYRMVYGFSLSLFFLKKTDKT